MTDNGIDPRPPGQILTNEEQGQLLGLMRDYREFLNLCRKKMAVMDLRADGLIRVIPQVTFGPEQVAGVKRVLEEFADMHEEIASNHRKIAAGLPDKH